MIEVGYAGIKNTQVGLFLMHGFKNEIGGVMEGVINRVGETLLLGNFYFDLILVGLYDPLRVD